ncbi:hypothetical protein QMO37_33145, partial [Pseudomonas aeruginosa]|nr:hypothetical protein [Pseudomonas aeruginosa]
PMRSGGVAYGAGVGGKEQMSGGLVWAAPPPARLSLGHGELPRPMQVNGARGEKKPEPTPQPPAAAPEPTPRKIEEPRPEPPKP